MTKSSFLDKGLLLGFCFSVDVHHRRCKEYLFSDETEHHITEYVRDAFSRNKGRLVRDHRKDLLHHARVLEKSSYTGELGPMELKEIARQIVNRSEYPHAWRYLRDYYGDHTLISVAEVTEELRNLARDIESNAKARFAEFDDKINVWERNEEYPDIQSLLDEIRQDKVEDFWICIDAHDLANRVDGYTELATTDFEDLIRNGRRELILENTALDDVVGVAVTTSQG